MESRPIYFDYHATTPVDPRVLEAMLPYFTTRFGNASSINHVYGWEAAEAVEHAREQAAALLNVPAKSLIFTSGATESNNLALKGVMSRAAAGSRLITTEVEHRAILDPARKLRRQGYTVDILPVNRYGQPEPELLAESLRTKTVLVSAIGANNEVGTLNPLQELGEVCHRHGTLLHSDLTQWGGKLPLDLSSWPVDLASFSAHKMYGPKGVGLLYVRPGLPRIQLEPLFDGGGHEQRLRSGTLAVPLIVGCGMACEIARQEMTAEAARVRELRDRLAQGLLSRLPDIQIHGDPHARLPGNLNFSVPGVDGEALMNRLTEIAVSSGSACTAADPEPSHVLRALGVSEPLARASLRFGLGRFTTAAEVDFAIDYVSGQVLRLRDLAGQRSSEM